MLLNPFDFPSDQRVSTTAGSLVKLYELGVFAGSMDMRGGKVEIDCELQDKEVVDDVRIDAVD